ncbi:MAG TPA: sigma-70 family RNA polymerase sigma factor [Phycisphaerales bacterium]
MATPARKPLARPGRPAARSASFADVLPTLLDEHGPKLYALARRLCGNETDAQDMMQEVFLQAARRWETFRGESNPATWIYSIAAHSCGQRKRRRFASDRRMPAFSQIAPWTESTVSRAALGGPVTNIERKESERALHVAIVRLPQAFRVPLVMKEMLELPISEVAHALNLKEQTVKTRVHRARLMLRKALTSELKQVEAPDPIYEKQVCMDLLQAKLDAMDHARGFPIGQDVLCERCRAVFKELDLVQDTCAKMTEGKFPDSLRRAIVRANAEVPEKPLSKARPRSGKQ